MTTLLSQLLLSSRLKLLQALSIPLPSIEERRLIAGDPNYTNCWVVPTFCDSKHRVPLSVYSYTRHLAAYVDVDGRLHVGDTTIDNEYDRNKPDLFVLPGPYRAVRPHDYSLTTVFVLTNVGQILSLRFNTITRKYSFDSSVTEDVVQLRDHTYLTSAIKNSATVGLYPMYSDDVKYMISPREHLHVSDKQTLITHEWDTGRIVVPADCKIVDAVVMAGLSPIVTLVEDGSIYVLQDGARQPIRITSNSDKPFLALKEDVVYRADGKWVEIKALLQS